MPAPKKYPDELRERAVRLVFESKRPIAHVATDLGVHKEALRSWVRQAERDAGGRQDGLTSVERDELARLRGEVKQLSKANEILKAALKNRGVGGKGHQRLKLVGDSPADWIISLAALHLTAARVAHETGASTPTATPPPSASATSGTPPTTSRSRIPRSTRPGAPRRPIRRRARSRRARCAARRRTARTPGSATAASPPLGRLDSRGGRAFLCQLAGRIPGPLSPSVGRIRAEIVAISRTAESDPRNPASTGDFETPTSRTKSRIVPARRLIRTQHRACPNLYIATRHCRGPQDRGGNGERSSCRCTSSAARSTASCRRTSSESREPAHAEVLHACEATIERLATDRHYFARPARTLFNDIRMHFPIGVQPRVWQVVHDVRRRRPGLARQAAAARLRHQRQPARVPRDDPPRNAVPARCRCAHNGYCPSHQHLAETEEYGQPIAA